MSSYYVYIFIDPLTNLPFYIGKGTKDRYKIHFKETKENTINKRKYNKIHSIQNKGYKVKIEFPMINLNEEDAYKLEEFLIKYFGRIKLDKNGILTNICESAKPPSPKGRIVSLETRKKIGDKQRGILNHRFGKKISEEEKENKRKFNIENNIRPPNRTGIHHSQKTKEKMSMSSKGKPKSKSHRLSMSRARKGIPTRPCPEETKKKIAETQYRYYKVIKNDDRKFLNSKEFKNFLSENNISMDRVRRAMKKSTSINGYYFYKITKEDYLER